MIKKYTRYSLLCTIIRSDLPQVLSTQSPIPYLLSLLEAHFLGFIKIIIFKFIQHFVLYKTYLHLFFRVRKNSGLFYSPCILALHARYLLHTCSLKIMLLFTIYPDLCPVVPQMWEYYISLPVQPRSMHVIFFGQ